MLRHLLVAVPCSLGSQQRHVCLHTRPLGLIWFLRSLLMTMRKSPLGICFLGLHQLLRLLRCIAHQCLLLQGTISPVRSNQSGEVGHELQHMYGG